MILPYRIGYRVAATALLVGLAACSGGGAQAPSAQLAAASNDRQPVAFPAAVARIPAMVAHPRAMLPASQLMLGDADPLDVIGSKSIVYAAEFSPSQTNAYVLPDAKNVAPKCTVATSDVNDIGVDATGTLWIPQGSINRVTTYTKGTCTPAALTLNEPNGQPADIAFSSNGTVYVADIFNTSGGSGLISVYPKGASSPTTTLTAPSIDEADGIAIDKAGDVFLSTYHASTGSSTVVEFKKGKMPGRTLALGGFSEGIGLTFDGSQNLIAVDYHLGLIETYAPPYNGSPIATFPTKGSSVYGKLDRAEKNLYVSDATNGTIDVFKYPSGAYEYSISNGLTPGDFVDGVAVDPSAAN